MLRFLKKRVIHDCDKREPYLTRYFIIRSRLFSIYIHHFHKSDEGYFLHDHPSDFITIILKGGYYEWMKQGGFFKEWPHLRLPGDIIFRKAEILHRVELYKNECWTLVFLFRRRRNWGFYTDKGWVDSQEYLGALDCLD